MGFHSRGMGSGFRVGFRERGSGCLKFRAQVYGLGFSGLGFRFRDEVRGFHIRIYGATVEF